MTILTQRSNDPHINNAIANPASALKFPNRIATAICPDGTEALTVWLATPPDATTGEAGTQNSRFTQLYGRTVNLLTGIESTTEKLLGNTSPDYYTAVKVAPNPATNGYVIGLIVAGNKNYQLHSMSATKTLSGTPYATTVVPGTKSHRTSVSSFGFDTDSTGRVIWAYVPIDIDSLFYLSVGSIAETTVISSVPDALDLLAHRPSNKFHIAYIETGTLKVQKYSSTGVAEGSAITVDSGANAPIRIVGRYGDDGFTVVWAEGMGPDNIRYRAYDSSGSALYTKQTLSNGGNTSAWIDAAIATQYNTISSTYHLIIKA